MRVHWQRAPGWAQPEGLRSKGWTQLADGGVEIPLWSNGKGVIGAFRYKQREGGVLGRDRLWYTCSETGPKLKLLVEDLRSAERVEALAEAEVDQIMEELQVECDDGELDKVWAASVEEVYSVALDEQLERDEKMLKDACVAEVFEDIGKLQKQCRKFARKKLGKKKETWLDPPGEDSERARCLWLGNYPGLIEEIMMNFRSYSHRRLNGNLLAYVRKFLKERGYLHTMLKGAYPKLGNRDIDKLLRIGEKGPSFVHIDHFLAQLSDSPFNFVVMLGFANTAFAAAKKSFAKDLYVGRDVADEIREIALETIRRVRAIKAAYG